MVKQIDSLARGLRILDVLKTAGPLGLSDLSRRTGTPKASLLRVLVTLESEGFAWCGRTDRLWRASTDPRIGGDRRLTGRLAQAAAPALDALCQRVLWPSDIGVYDDGAIRVLENSRRISPFLVNRDIGRRRIHVLPSAMGRAILAWTDPGDRDRILADLRLRGDPQESVADSPDRVEALLSATRKAGYGVRQKGYFASSKWESQVMAVALPVRVNGRVVGAVNLSWVGSAMPEDRFVAEHLPALQRAAEQIGTQVAEAAPVGE
ncbi:helix-turn-helix domain-containing protein [Mesobaculum littorinae]|nr:helix-turn-helix domain-containing protein [Mesobaculum littorinae]